MRRKSCCRLCLPGRGLGGRLSPRACALGHAATRHAQPLLLLPLADNLRLLAHPLEVPDVVVILIVRLILVLPLAALKQVTTSRLLGLAGLLLGRLLADALLLPLGKALWCDGRERAGELVPLRLEEVLESERLERGLVQEGLFSRPLLLGLEDEAGLGSVCDI